MTKSGFYRPSARLLPEESQNDPKEERTTAVGNVFEDGCRVSNDPPANEDSGTPELKICDVISFRCVDDSSTETKTEPLQVSYDYELHYNPDADFDMILPYLEEAVLEHMATEMGVRNCVKSMGVRRRLQNSTTEEDLGRLQGLSLEPEDEPDQRYDSCAVNVDEEIAEKTECIPMQGAMTVYLRLTGEEKSAPEQEKDDMRKSILEFLETSMASDVYTASGNIEKVTFVGNRTALEEAAARKSSLDDGGLSRLAKGLISGAIVLFFLILLILCCVCRKRRKNAVDREASIVKKRRAMPVLDDEDDYHRRRRRRGTEEGFVLPGSLAYADSLALQPQQIYGGEKFADEGSYATEGTISVTLSPDKSATSPDSSLEESFPSMELSDYIDYQLSAISEGESQPESLVNSASPLSSTSPLNIGSLLHNSLTQTYSWDDECESDDYGSDYTPRGTLQMT